ncbi:MAG TPA: cobyric acid synthase, partial [Nitriliruptorales bacterium]
MVQGCTSWAGKSFVATALCRWFARQGVPVAPFKAQNMSNNARVVAGGEIGVAQWLQARAAGVEPDVRMNPILLKPEAGGSQVVRLGRADRELSRRPWRDRSHALWPAIESSLADLLDAFDVVVIEGAGSPAEINLAASDVVNMRVAERAAAPVLLVVDIDRGGAFAHLYGTWTLLEERHRGRVEGFVLNRFRGDVALLPPGPQQLERLTGVATIGVLPMLDHDLPDEDGAALHAPRRGGLPQVAVVRYPAASNLDEFTLLEQVADVRWATAPWHIDGVTTVVLPGSKHVAADLAWLASTGLDRAVRDAAAAGVRTLGICGGLQL